MPKPKLRLFFDESGNLGEEDFYFGCVVNYNVDYSLEKQLEHIFKEKNIEWRKYHACSMGGKDISKEILKRVKDLYPELNIVVAKFQDAENTSYQLYYPILIETVLFVLREINDKSNIDIIIEHKENIDQRELTLIMSTLIEKEFNLQSPPALRISPQIKGDNIVLIVCDIVSNLAYYGDIDFLKKIGVNIIDITKINIIKNQYSQIIDALYKKDKKAIIKKIVKKEVVEKKVVHKIITKEKITPLASKFIELLSTYHFQKDKKLNFQKALSLFKKEENNLGIVVEILREAKNIEKIESGKRLLYFLSLL